MCVIMCYEDELPKLAQLESAELLNSDGGGISWIEKDRVYWHKGLTASEILDLIKKRKIQLPVIVHFRIASIGGTTKELTHPFPITNGVPLNLKGYAKEVLFHNGHWQEWRDMCIKTMIKHKLEFPRDVWSDSRGMAWLASIYGKGMLNLVTNSKIAVMTTKGIERYGDDWKRLKGTMCSNDHFDHKQTNLTSSYNYSDDDYKSSYNSDYGYWKDGKYTSYKKFKKKNKNKKKKVDTIDTGLVVVDSTKNSPPMTKDELEKREKQLKEDVKIKQAEMKVRIEETQRTIKEEIQRKNNEIVYDTRQFSTADEVIAQGVRETKALTDFKETYEDLGDELLSHNFARDHDFRKRYLRKTMENTNE